MPPLLFSEKTTESQERKPLLPHPSAAIENDDREAR